MDDDPRLSRAFDLIRKVVADAYKRGADNAREQIIQTAVKSASFDFEPTPASPDDADLKAERQRGPRGSVRQLIDRTLAKYAPQGINVAGIYGCREGSLEEMISLPSIRAELRKGLVDGRYRLDKGCWFLKTLPESHR
jgi:hypothetical protein